MFNIIFEYDRDDIGLKLEHRNGTGKHCQDGVTFSSFIIHFIWGHKTSQLELFDVVNLINSKIDGFSSEEKER